MLSNWDVYRSGPLKNLANIDRNSLETIAVNALNDPKVQLLDYIHNLGLSQTIINEIWEERQLMVPEERKIFLNRFEKVVRQGIPSLDPNFSQRINPFTRFEKHPPLFFGIGGGSRTLSKGLPFDVVSMVLTAEKLRRELGLSFCYLLMANRSYTSKNPEFSDQAIDRLMAGERDLLQMVVEKFGIGKHWEIFLQSDLEKIIGPSLKEGYERFVGDADIIDFVGGHYCAVELADIWSLVGQEEIGGVKLGWAMRKVDKAHEEYLMDEQPFDARFTLFMALANRQNTTSFAYTQAGARLFPGGTGMLEKVPPYICYQPSNRLLLSPFENPVKKLAETTRAGGGFNFKFVRKLFGSITSLFEEIILGKDERGWIKRIPLSKKQPPFKGYAIAEKTNYILRFLFEGETEAQKIWSRTFPTP